MTEMTFDEALRKVLDWKQRGKVLYMRSAFRPDSLYTVDRARAKEVPVLQHVFTWRSSDPLAKPGIPWTSVPEISSLTPDALDIEVLLGRWALVVEAGAHLFVLKKAEEQGWPHVVATEGLLPVPISVCTGRPVR